MTLLRSLLRVVLWTLSATPLIHAAEPAAADIKVLSYNLRYGTAADGENHWDKRKDFMAETLKAVNPDLLGTQETLDFQRDFLAKTLPTHAVLAVGREDGREKGEMTAIYWRKDRFEKVDGGHFWLSTTPAEVGSKGWDAALPRMATWVRLKDKTQEGKPILWINTHFDHQGEVARTEAAKLLRERVATLGHGCSVIVTGDFNSAEDSAAYHTLFGPHENTATSLLDTYRAMHPQRAENEGTTTPFLAAVSQASRIDWIGVSRDWKVLAAGIDHPDRAGRTPSDHFPIHAVLRR